MRRLRKILLYLIGTLLLLPVLAVVALLVALNTPQGQDFAASEIASLTGNTVQLQDLRGRFPDHLTLARLQISDTEGPYLTATNIGLDWSPLALIHKQALIHSLTAATLDFARLPAPDPNANPNAQPFQLPVRVTGDHVDVARVTLGQPVLAALNASTGAVAKLDGQIDLPTLQTGSATIAITRLDVPGTYTLRGSITADRTEAHLAVAEPANGLIASIADLPAIGPIAIKADIDGPQSALATTLTLAAGPLTAAAAGTIDLPGSTLALDVHAHAPAMHPADTVAWRAIALDAHVAGPFTAPDATGQLDIQALQAQGASLQQLAANLAGNAGHITVKATATGLTIPGPTPDLLAAAPIQVSLAARLDDPTRPITFSLSHPLIAFQGTATTGTSLAANATLDLPNLTPLARIANLDLAGNAHLNIHAAQPRTGTTQGTTTLAADGTIGLTAGPAPAPDLIGPAAKISIAAETAGTTVTVTHATIDGAALALDAHGQTTEHGVDATARIVLSNLALAAPTLTGQATLDAHVQGPLDKIALDATLAGEVGAPGVPQGPVKLTLAATGLPTAPAGHLTAIGTFEGAPINLALDATRDPAGTLQATIQQADWRSLHAEGALTLAPGATIPVGHVTIRFPQLADLRPIIGQPIAGGLTAALTLGPDAATLDAEIRNTGLPGSQIGSALIKARVTSPTTNPVLAATLTADNIDASGTTGSIRIEANGPADALAVRTQAKVITSGIPTQLNATAELNATAKQLRLTAFQLDATPPGYPTPETLRLQAPATIAFGNPIGVDHLRLALRSNTLDISGRLSPTLDTTITLKANAADLPLPLGEGRGEGSTHSTAPYSGSITLDAKLTGSPAAPSGTIRLNATNLRARTGPAAAIPAATLAATAQLTGHAARINATLTAGSANLAVSGQAPLGQGALNLHATGGLDLTLLDPILSAQGRQARGRATLDATVAGTTAAPAISGQLQLARGEIQDFTQGLRIYGIAATIRADGQTIRIASLTGRAGPGTIAAAGTIGIFAPGLPVDLTLTARNARPLSSDTISATLDADLTVKGAVDRGLQAGGKISILHAELGIPDTLPASVAVLPVHRPGDKPPAPPGPPAAPAAPTGLDLTIQAPGQIFIRGRGLDAEMAGNLIIKGTSAQPQLSGGLDMRNGTIDVAGTTLTFTQGKIGFDGTGLSGKIDPTIDFIATSTTDTVTATLEISGTVSKPKITLSSSPELPQDEVLAYLLFKRSAKDLGPFQIAEIAAGLVQLTGVGGSGGFNPLDSVRKGLGLDRLAVGSTTTTSSSGATTSTPTIEAGRYVANGVYVGAKQGTSGNETQATVQIDLTKGLKLETDVGSGTGGNQVGLTYQFEY
jgi:translocation and assembly module TamB